MSPFLLLFYVKCVIMIMYLKTYAESPSTTIIWGQKGKFMNNYTCKTIGTKCRECRGACLDKTNPSQKQKNARKMFGITPNSCVPDEDGTSRCPYAAK